MSSEPPRKRGTKLRNTALTMLGLLLLLLAAAAWLVGTNSGARTVLTMLSNASGGSYQVGTVDGRLAGPLRLQRLTVQRDGLQLDLHELRLDWAPAALLEGRVHLRSLRIGKLDLTNRIKQDEKPASLPASLALPFKLQIDTAQIERGTINWGPVNLIELGAFTIHLDYDGTRYRLGLDQLTANVTANASAINANLHGQVELGSSQPYPVSASFASQADAQVRQQQFDARGTFGVQGSLAEMVAAVDFAVGDAHVKGQALLRPFSERPLGHADLDIAALDLAAFGAGMPHTSISGKLAADEQGGTVALFNAESGTLDAARLPLQSLQIKFRQQARRFTFEQITAALGSARQPAGDMRGTGSLVNGALALTLNTDSLNLQGLDRRLLATRLAGQATLHHAGGKQELTLAASEPLRQNRLMVSVKATLADAALALEHAELKLGKGQVRAAGQVQLDGNQQFNMSGTVTRFRLQDLGQFAQVPNLYLTGSFSLRGVRVPQLAAELQFNLADSQLAGHPLHGAGTARLRADSIDIPKLLLAAGANRVSASGKLTQTGGNLSFSLSAPQLAQLGAGFGGSLQANGTVRGSFARPRADVQWQASRLQTPGPLQVGSMQGRADVTIDRNAPLWLHAASIDLAGRDLQSGAQRLAELTAAMRFAPQPNAPLSLQIEARNLVTPTLKADRFTANARGTTARHTLAISLLEPSQQWQLQASGGLQDLARAPHWQGILDQLGGSGRFAVSLDAPAPLQVSQQRVQLDRLRLHAQSTTIAIDHFLRDARGIVTRGNFAHLQAGALLALVNPQPPVKTDLLLGGQWDLALTDAARGTLSVQRESGDIAMLGTAPVALGLRRLEASANLALGRLNLQFSADGAQLGQLNLQAGVAVNASLRNPGIAPQAPVSGTAQFRLPSLRWAGPLVAPNAVTEGSLHSEIALSGTFSQPRFSGFVNGNALRLALPDLGLNLRQGTLSSSFQDTRLVIDKLAFEEGGGSLVISGPIDLAGAKPDAVLALKAERFTLLDRSDRRLVVSSDSRITLRDGRLQVTGALNVINGRFDIGRADKPQLSDDVVVVGQQQGKPGTALALDLAVALGDGVTISGRGIDALLVGQLKLTSDAGAPIRAQGTLRIAKGTYTAYGRALAIEQGNLRFNGALANPGLDILAMRRGQEVEAGVAVRGSVLAPRISLVSEPTVPDAEKLSWLVLGRGLDTATGGGDMAALQSAAGALLTEGAAAGVQSRLAGAFGLDQLSIGTSADTLQQRIITLGKQVSSRLYVSIEQGLETTSSVLQLRYTLSRRITLEVDTGTRTAFTLFYNFAFD